MLDYQVICAQWSRPSNCALYVSSTCPEAGLIHQSRGGQYVSQAFRARLAAHQLVASMSRRAGCYDNSVMESFFGTLKTELVSFARHATRAEARVATFEYIEVHYNRQQRHSTLGYVSRVECGSRAA